MIARDKQTTILPLLQQCVNGVNVWVCVCVCVCVGVCVCLAL